MKKFFMAMIASLALTVGAANAGTLSGTVSFGGNVQTPVNPNSNSVTFLFSVLPSDITSNGTLGSSTGQLALTPPNYVYMPNTTLTSANASGFIINFGPNSASPAYTFTGSGFAGPTLVSSLNANAVSVILYGAFSSGANSSPGSITFSFQSGGGIAPAGVSTYSAEGSSVPEPATYAMLGSALLGLGFLRRRKA